MASMRWAGCLVLALGLAGGCAPKPQPAPPPPPEPPPATPEIISARQAELRKQDPNAEVGGVVEVLPDKHMAAISDVPVQDFHAGDTLVIMNTAMQHVANATVDTTEGRYIVVKYENAVREVRPGDLAVRVSEHGRLPGQSAMPQNEPANGGSGGPSVEIRSSPERSTAPDNAGGSANTNAQSPANGRTTNNESPLPAQPAVPTTRPTDANPTGGASNNGGTTGSSSTTSNDNTVPSPGAGTPPPADNNNARRPELNK